MDKISEDEFELQILKFGSFLGMLNDKHMSCVTVFITIFHDEFMRELLKHQLDCEWYDIVHYMTFRYPILHKSKKVSNSIE